MLSKGKTSAITACAICTTSLISIVFNKKHTINSLLTKTYFSHYQKSSILTPGGSRYFNP